MPRKKKGITLAEHIKRIAPLGGKARAENLTAAQLSAIGRKGGAVGGAARAAALTPEQRRAVAKKAAAARWGKKAK